MGYSGPVCGESSERKRLEFSNNKLFKACTYKANFFMQIYVYHGNKD